MKPRLLIFELWGLGDLAIATPFIRRASEKFEVTLLAKPYALDLQTRFWPGVKVIPFNAPWTAFSGKYQLWKWPWLKLIALWLELRREKFSIGVSSRSWDPRDHFLMRLVGIPKIFGFQRVGSRMLFALPSRKTPRQSHRYEYWRRLATQLDFELPTPDKLTFPPQPASRTVLIHAGAAQRVRVWPLPHYLEMVRKLRDRGYRVQVACDPAQLAWWEQAGENRVAVPNSISALIELIDHSGVFIGNDSGPGHLAAFCGLPTFTFFGPQVPEWFLPLHPASEIIAGKSCPYKPCSDYCRYPIPYCLSNISELEAWPRIEAFVHRHLHRPAPNVRVPVN